MNTVAAFDQSPNSDKQSALSHLKINQFVQSALKVIVPLDPIHRFAARSPWAGLEEQSFEQTARRQMQICGIDIYPSEAILCQAKNQGEIREEFLEKSMQKWLDMHLPDLPREAAEQFCRAALKLDRPPEALFATPELSALVQKVRRTGFQITESCEFQTYSRRLEQQSGIELASKLDRFLIKWCKLFLDESQASWPMPFRENGFYNAWKKIIRYEPGLTKEMRKFLKLLPETSEETLWAALSALNIPESMIEGYLKAHLLALPGWAGAMLWRSQHISKPNTLMTDYLAVRIWVEWTLLQPHLLKLKPEKEVQISVKPLLAEAIHWGGIPLSLWSELSDEEIKARIMLAYDFDLFAKKRLLLEAWEETYEHRIKEMIIFSEGRSTDQHAATVAAQFVFCIDVRSEPLRRKIEQSGPFETLGTAGFFGLPIEKYELGSVRQHPSLPVISKPELRVVEISTASETERYQNRKQLINSIHNAFQTMKQNLLTSLLLPEISAPWFSMQLFFRSILPRKTGTFIRQIREAWMSKPETDFEICHRSEWPDRLTIEEKADYVKQALVSMGLTEQFAPLVVFCGHGSRSANNPYAAALDCGACGGASGEFNARVLAKLCNEPEIRNALAARGISIPECTAFAAAEHVTTLDEINWVYVPELSKEAYRALNHVQSVLPDISEQAKADRISKLPNNSLILHPPYAAAERLAEDWSELRPEWGLAGNAAIIIGECRLTMNCDLEGRVFLHNYEWQKDTDGAILESIIAGPVQVAQWINLQYYASAVVPHYYGSGDKATQTVTSGIGVMQGNASDLLFGLPWQTVMRSEGELYHTPLRLLVVIQAPEEYVDRLLRRVPEFRQKIENRWLRLASIDSEGQWKSWS
ncbi:MULTISPECIES: DUF2309 domain-containing protein [unclassified Paenibacillus]|uniref:DUF2309 domain-containing protein n=1 Tax=unclassified Paenibacillus TaxID=185978 RepID=UPI00030F1ECD|nr:MULTISPECIES: putative inorganic carbon transporter subunit DabA [unclassified Paenibacillus]MCT2196960.1 Na-translocating system protein MpsB [Paenibacillus sp. p3-SID1389]